MRHRPHPPPGTQRWSKERVLAEARARCKEASIDNPAQAQQLLEDLCVEAGWSGQEFLEALIQDVASRNRQQRH